MGTARKYAVPFLGAALAVGLTACGGGDDSKSGEGQKGAKGTASSAPKSADRSDAKSVIAAAAKKTADVTAYKIDQKTKNSEGDRRSEQAWRKKPVPLTVVKTTENKPGQKARESYSIVTGGSVYTKTDKVPATGKSWFKIETQAGRNPNRVEGLLPGRLGVLGATASTKWVGSEPVGSHPADRYSATVVLSELATYEGPAMNHADRDEYVLAAKDAGESQVVVDVWVGKDDIVLKSQEHGKGKHGDEVVTEEYSDYGIAPKEEAPPASAVLTWDEYMAALTKG
ncbi:hypothetical protein ACFYNY_33970 [Streptomyces sp. NPDC006530]|uniref:hypothetical protein n=1 Tax=Streptomyces sp. NPDC006530 TaxID=3364750 RepID=UPI00367E19AA